MLRINTGLPDREAFLCRSLQFKKLNRKLKSDHKMKVAVVGATGLVGTKMLQVLAERNFPVTELIPVASEKSVGKKVSFKGKDYEVVSWQTAIDKKPEVAIFSAGGTTSKELAPKFAAAG